MLCEICHQRDATMHLTQIINNSKKEINLCDVCAAQEGLNISNFKFDNFIADFFNDINVNTNYQAAHREKKKCPKCGLTENNLLRYGKLGCSDCYQHFNYRVEPLLRKVHGNNKHTGKIPLRAGEKIKGNQEIEKLKVLMQEAIKEEEFEKAAILRDKIRALELTKERGTI